MDEKLEELVALLRRPPRVRPPAPPPPPPRGAAAVVARARAIREGWPLPRPSLSLPVPGPWLAYGGAAAALAVIFLGAWLALPSPPAQQHPVAAAAPAAPPPMPSPERVTVTTGKITLPFPSEAEEQGEMTKPDPDEAPEPPPVPNGTKVAALPPPPRPVPPQRLGEPAWLRFAVPAPPIEGRPRIAIVIDDVGLDKKRSERAVTLPGPLTLSFLPYASDLPRLTEEAHRAGHELLVHVPMEPLSHSEDMGPNGLAVGLGPEEVLRRLRWDLARFDGYVGINNHMGSRFTGDAAAMTPVMEELKARGLLFLDSRTIGNSTGIELARQYGVPHAGRDVFLDNEVNGRAIAAELAEVEQIARRHGSAIAIGHPHDATLDQLTTWLASLPAKGFVLVPLSTIVKEQTKGGGTG